MPLDTRALWVDYASLLAGDRSSTRPAMTAAEKAAIANEVYLWLYTAMTPRVSYVNYGGFTHADGTTVGADSGLVITAAADGTMDLVLTNIEEMFSVHFEGASLSSTSTIESVPRLEYLEHNEFLAQSARLADAVAPRYVHWERLGVAGTSTPDEVGKWRLSVAPAKLQTSAEANWYFSLVCRRGLSNPDTSLASASPLSADASIPDLLPHETYLGARLTAYEIMMKTGVDAKWPKRLVRNVPSYLMRSFIAARGLGEATVSA